MVMVYVPEGSFIMGSNRKSESPSHTVWLDAFWIDRTEVTNMMYSKCVQAGECTPPMAYKSSTRSSYYNNPEFGNYPVIYVSWNQARAYCEWTGRRLPTEAEWEKAARGEDGRSYPWGNKLPQTTLLNSLGYHKDTVAVDEYAEGASPYGASNMAGNVWEWVNDWYGEYFYGNSPDKNPVGPGTGTTRVLRGGGWASDANQVRVTTRSGDLRPNEANDRIGFRCLLSPSFNVTGSLIALTNAAQISCPGAQTPRLWVGGYAYVNNEPPLANRVRSGHGKDYTGIGNIQPGKAMEIIDGPECANNWIWWKIRELENNLIGWTAEGDDQGYWLVPCSSVSECNAH